MEWHLTVTTLGSTDELHSSGHLEIRAMCEGQDAIYGSLLGMRIMETEIFRASHCSSLMVCGATSKIAKARAPVGT